MSDERQRVWDEYVNASILAVFYKSEDGDSISAGAAAMADELLAECRKALGR